MKLSIVTGVFLLLLLLMTSCSYENEYDICISDTDSLVITYTDLVPVFELNCIDCHGPNLSYNGVRVDQYEVLKNFALSGRLYNAVNHIGDGPKMPKNAGKLDPCSLSMINNWMENGAQK